MLLTENYGTGMFGLVPVGSEEQKTDNGYADAFDPFWNGIGIFHDVFEHWFEHVHKYFRGEFSQNIGGEIAATGAMQYFINTLGVYNRQAFITNKARSVEDVLIDTTLSFIQEAVEYGYTRYGDTIACNVPYQRPLDDYKYLDFEEAYLEKFKEAAKENFQESSHSTEREKYCAEHFKSTLNTSDVVRLLRWGYKQAERLVFDSHENRVVCDDFIDFWDAFCKRLDAKSVYEMLGDCEVEISVFKNKHAEISWEAHLKYYNKKIDLKEIYYLEDFYKYID